MKKIKIVSRWDGNRVLLCGEYESIKDCLEKNNGADLHGAYLGDAYLGGANLRGAYLRGANLCDADLHGANLRDADLGGANLCGADLRDADLDGAYLCDADLDGAYLCDADLGDADLGDADLGGAKNYYNSHDFALAIIRRQSIKTFTEKEWAVIGQIALHRFCWGTIRKQYKRAAFSVCRKLAKAGFDEYLNVFKGD